MPVQSKAFSFLLSAALLLSASLNLLAQGTAISYQGRLNDSGAPANASYDFRFAVFNAPTNGAAVSAYVTNAAVPVSNGLFSVTLDFGPGIFNGTSNGSNDWMDIAVRATSATAFTPLVPRQPILPVPYALFATSASNLLGTLSAAQLTGTAASSLITGAYTNVVNFSNPTNIFVGAFSGAGSNLTSLNASQITSGTLADARLTANVDLLNANQTVTGTKTFANTNFFTGPNTFSGSNFFTGANVFTGSNTFNGINTFTNNGNYFQGSFFGNGLVGWLPVLGTSTNAMRDAGYLMLNGGLSTLTLPATASLLVGDIVRISGGGGGGWLVKENTGQSIMGNFARYTNSVLTFQNGVTAQAYDIAGSADGVRMYVVGNDIIGISASSDYGRSGTWNTVGGLSGSYISIACSADGKIVYAEPYPSGTIIMSVNGGLTWTSSGRTGNGTFIGCTANGTLLPAGGTVGGIACSGNGTYQAQLSGTRTFISTNGGSSFTVPVTNPASFFCLAVSSDCTRMVGGANNGLLYASANQGATWTPLTSTNLLLEGAWMSSDGSRFAAAAFTSGVVGGGIVSASVSPLPNTISTNNTICGSQGSAAELQYLGNGQFMPVGSTGLLWAN